MSVKRETLLSTMRRCQSSHIEEQFKFLEDEMPELIRTSESRLQFKVFKSQFRSRWSKASRTLSKFMDNNKAWLASKYPTPVLNAAKRGRPKTDFDSSSDRTKRLKTQKLRTSTPVSVLSYATQMALRAEGSAHASEVLRDITTTTPSRASKYKKAYKRSLEQEIKIMSGEDALAMMIKAKLSRSQYEVVRASAPDRFPSYKVIQKIKTECYPRNTAVTETSASVPLQDLLNHTSERLSQSIGDVLKTHVNDSELQKLRLYSKWGFDGSSGHSEYKQAFHGNQKDDSAVFITCIVPLKLTCGEKLLWQNPNPSSTSYCRPIKIEFIKESSDVSKREKTQIDEQIKNLKATEIISLNRIMHIQHKLVFSMVDGKVCNAISETTSTQKCYLCDASSKMFNNIDAMIDRDVRTEYLGLGISVLHGWIRMMECLLHIAYKLPIKKWQARGDDKKIVADTKRQIQKEFREKCGLIVDKPKPGFGNSNDGNTARRFFQNPEVSAEITKLDLELIRKLHTIMIVIASSLEIDIDKFQAFAHDTARYFVSLYPWFNMSPTMHKYLIHGSKIIAKAWVPIGQLSEEAQEARNKDFKRFREHNSRKNSRINTNQDIFNLFLISSDPLISGKRNVNRKKKQIIPEHALNMIREPRPREFESSDDNEEEDDDEDNFD